MMGSWTVGKIANLSSQNLVLAKVQTPITCLKISQVYLNNYVTFYLAKKIMVQLRKTYLNYINSGSFKCNFENHQYVWAVVRLFVERLIVKWDSLCFFQYVFAQM